MRNTGTYSRTVERLADIVEKRAPKAKGNLVRITTLTRLFMDGVPYDKGFRKLVHKRCLKVCDCLISRGLPAHQVNKLFKQDLDDPQLSIQALNPGESEQAKKYIAGWHGTKADAIRICDDYLWQASRDKGIDDGTGKALMQGEREKRVTEDQARRLSMASRISRRISRDQILARCGVKDTAVV